MPDRANWDMWDDRYSTDGFLFGTAPSVFVRRHTHRIAAGESVLAIADGEGRNSVHLAAHGAIVTAMDSSDVGLEKARGLAQSQGVSVDFQLGDLYAWDWSAVQYDCVMGVFFQFAPPDKRAGIFAGIDQALRPGGLLLLHGFAPRQVRYGTGGPPNPEHMYTMEMLREAFAGYSVEHIADYDEEIDAGPGHNGICALIDFVARKPG